MSRPWNALNGVLNTLHSLIENSNDICDPDHVKAVKDLPKAFVEVAKWLPIMKRTLGNSKRRFQERRNQEETREIQYHYKQLTSSLGICKDKADTLKCILDEVLYVEDQSTSDRYQDVAEPSERVEKLMIDALNGVLELSKAPVPLVNDEEARMLQQGLKELGMLPPSLVEDKSGNVVTNKGPGTQINHFGRGAEQVNQSPNAPMMVGTFQGAHHKSKSNFPRYV